MSQPTSLGALRDTGYRSRSVKTEIRENLLARLRSGQTAFPGIVGFDETVLPQLESALLAGHDVVLLGERGQGKTRVMRTIGQLLDEWTPMVEGCEINDDPLVPVCARCRRLAAETGGSYYEALSSVELTSIYSELGRRLASQYLLSYSPNNLDEGGFHNIRVEVNVPGLKIRTRPGYWIAGRPQ